MHTKFTTLLVLIIVILVGVMTWQYRVYSVSVAEKHMIGGVCEPAMTTTYNKLIAHSWVWKETIKGTEKITPKKPTAFVVSFMADGNVRGSTDCNSFGGTYNLEQQQIFFSSMVATEMACGGSQEQEFLSMLKKGNITIEGETLTIVHDQTVTFEKQSAPSAPTKAPAIVSTQEKATGFITSAYTLNGKNYIDIDYVTLRHEKGDMPWGTIVNDNTKIRTFEISPSAIIRVLTTVDGNLMAEASPTNMSGLKEAVSLRKNTLWNIVVKDGVVVEMQEEFRS